MRFFFNNTIDAINPITFLNDSDLFDTRIYNTGKISQYGFQFSGALKLGKIMALNPYVKIFNIRTQPNAIAREYQIDGKQQFTYETGLSAIASFKHDWTATFRIQYYHPKTDMQSIQFSDALYFVSMEKNINKKLKVGIISGLPFKHSFVYHGENIQSDRFYQHAEGNIQLSPIPFWFSIHHEFNSGKKVHTIKREKETIDSTPQKGF